MSRGAILCGIFIACLAAPFSVAFAEQWVKQRESHLGFAYSYPSDVFEEIAGDGKPGFHYFESTASEAKFLVGGWNNKAQQTPESFKRWVIANAGGYDEVTYRPRGRSWFVLSGYRGDTIYYEKVMFSCREKLVSIFAISYPTAERDLFDPIVERMENTFRPGRGCPSGS